MTFREPNASEAWLVHARRNLSWLLEDGYEETRVRVLRSRFLLEFSGPHGQVTVTVYPGMEAVQIWLRPRGRGAQRRSMWEYLNARGLKVPRRERIDTTSVASVNRAIDAYTESLEQLRDKELSGDWTPPG